MKRIILGFFLILSFVFPKAGTKVKDIPLYLSVISSFLVAFYILYKKVQNFFNKNRRIDASFLFFWFLSAYLVLNLYLNIILNFSSCFNEKVILFVSAIISLLFLIFVYFQEVFKLPISYWIKIITFSFWFLSIYGLAQKIFGDYTVVIPGLSAAYSEAIKPNFLASKNNMVWGLNYIKLSSTYQNGNLFGVNYILISWFYFYFLQILGKRRVFKISLILYTLICILTASATVISGCFFSLLLLIVLNTKNRLKIKNIVYLFLLIIAIVLVSLIIFFEFRIFIDLLEYRLFDRDISQMGGRIPNLLEYLRNLDLRSFLLGGSLSCAKGGVYEITLMAIFYFFGILCMPIFILFLFILLKKISFKSTFSIGILTYLLISFSDGAFWLPPTPVNFSILLGLAIYLSKCGYNNNILLRG